MYKILHFQFASTWYGQSIANSSIIVDTFFLMGGLLAWNSLLKDFDRGRFSFYRFYFHRYLRITPLYAGILFFLAAFSGRLGSGPDWNIAQYQSEDCRSYWWSNLLFINNFIPSSSTFVSENVFKFKKTSFLNYFYVILFLFFKIK